MIDASVIRDFIAKTQGPFDNLEQVVLRLEDAGDKKDVLRTAFRSVQAITGDARLAGLKRLAELSHKLENLLDRLIQGEKEMDQGMFDTLEEAKDRMAMLVDDLRNFREEKTGIDDVLARIHLHQDRVGDEDMRYAGTDENQSAEDQIELSEEFSTLFDPIEDEGNDFGESPDILSALGIEEQTGKSGDDAQHPERSAMEKAERASETGKKKGSSAGKVPHPPRSLEKVPDAASLKKEIEKEVCDNELFDIFIRQLKDNISLLRTLTDNFDSSADKYQIISQCSDLIALLHSSANYMGYDRLTEFYGQWIAELEMAGMEMSMDSSASFDFMTRNIRIIDELFPQIKDMTVTEETIDEIPAEPFPLPSSPLIPSVEMPAADFHDDETDYQDLHNLFSTVNDADEADFTNDSTAIAALAEEEVAPPAADITGQADEGEDFFQDGGEEPDDFSDTGEAEEPAPAEPERKRPEKPRKPSRPARVVADTASIKNEITSEEYDEELFNIFMQQLQENITLLSSLNKKLPKVEDQSPMIKQCSDLVTALHSSANYMGYDLLSGFYEQWIAELEMSGMQLSLGNPGNLDFMADNIAAICEIFPEIEISAPVPDLQPEAAGPAAPEPAMPDETEPVAALSGEDDSTLVGDDYDEIKEAFADDLEDVDEIDVFFDDKFLEDEKSSPASIGRRQELFAEISGALKSLDRLSEDSLEIEEEREQEEDQGLFDRLSEALEADEITAEQEIINGAFDTEENFQLFDRLSSALDERKFDYLATEEKSIDDIVEEILSGHEHQDAEAVSAEASPPADEEFSGEAIIRTIDSDRRQSFTDRRLGPEDRRLTDPLQLLHPHRSIRVETAKIDDLMNQVGELVISRSSLSRLYKEIDTMQEQLSRSTGLKSDDLKPLRNYADRLHQANNTLARISNDIREVLLNVRMVPAAHLFKRYPRSVREMINGTDRKVELKTIGDEAELDKMILEEISDPLLNIIRYSIDHNIESIDERKAANKDETATLLLEVIPGSNAIVIEISDDGRGIDPQKIKDRALELDLVTPQELDALSDRDAIHLIMTPGFLPGPTAAKTSERAVGMDTVRNDLEKIKGTIDIRNRPGEGTTFRIKIPLAVSVIQALAVSVGSRILTVPVLNITETTRVRKEDISGEGSLEFVRHRGAALPVFRLAEVLDIQADTVDSTHVFILVVTAKGQRAGLIVDGFMRPGEAVVKPLADFLKKESGFSGATIREDGYISLVLDIAALLNLVMNRVVDDKERKALEISLQEPALD